MRKLSYFYILLFCGVLSSCTSVYLPNVPNTPMFTQKGQLHLEGHLSLKTNFSLNSAYAVNDHFGVMLNGSSVNTENNSSALKQGLVEGGIGYFNTFDEEKHRVFEIYLGLGKANTTKTVFGDDNNAPEVQKFGIQKVFLQSNFSNNKAGKLRLFDKSFPLSYGTALRFSFMHMNAFTINGVNQEFEENTFFEPVFFTRLNLSKNVQLQYTTGTTLGFSKRKYLKAGNSAMTFGIIFNFGIKE